MTSEKWVGKSVPRVDGKAKVTGAAVFSSDIYVDGMLHCRPVLAPCPHGRLISIQIEDALAVPGVVRVLTAEDIPGSKQYNSLWDENHPVLCTDKVRYIGEMVAVVVAESEKAAEEGAKKVSIDHTPLTLISDPELVIAGGYDVQVHDGQDNILKEIHFSRGDVSEVFGRSDVLTLEKTYHLQAMDHAFLETESAVAMVDGDGVKVISGSQSTFHNRAQVAKCLDLPEEKVVMVEAQTGGAFGGKANITGHILAALAACLTRRPCRMHWTRREHFLSAIKRHPLSIKLKTAITGEGDLAALQARIVVDTGAYVEIGTVFLDTVIENLSGPYKVPNIKLDAWLVHTNNQSSGAFRGLGASEGCTVIESQMSQMAKMINMDAITFRRRNLLAKGDIHGAGHELLLPVGTAEALDIAAEHPIWHERMAVKEGSSGNIQRGVGVAIGMKGYSMGINDAYDYEAAIMELLPNGRIQLRANVLEGGQGSLTVLSQIAAEAMNCPMSMIDILSADTSATLDAGMTAASRMTYIIGRATEQASEDLSRQILEVAADELKLPLDKLEIRDGRVVDPGSGKYLGLDYIAEAANKTIKAEVKHRVPLSDQPSSGVLGHPHVLYSSMTQIAQVAVDIDSGDVKVERVVCFPDLGRAINPQSVEGQCEGGVAQGLGYALMEQSMIEDGRVLNPNLSTYPIPTACDVPQVDTVLVEVAEASGPFGAKGIGENATVPAAAAILNAIEDAIGIRFTVMPVTPEKVIEALESRTSETK